MVRGNDNFFTLNRIIAVHVRIYLQGGGGGEGRGGGAWSLHNNVLFTLLHCYIE